MKHFTTYRYRNLRWSHFLLALVSWLAIGLTAAHAQVEVKPGIADTCYASSFVANTRVGPEHSMEEMQQLRRSAEARMAAPAAIPPVKTAEFIVEYNGFTPEAQAAFQYAVDIWSTIIVSDVPIRVAANFQPLSPGVLGSAGTTNLFAGFKGAKPNNWYVSALADAISGQDLNAEVDGIEDYPDISTRFSSVFNWYYGTDQNPAPDQYDFVSVVLHELGHGLGFTGFASVDEEEVGTIRFNYRGLNLPVIYSDFVKDEFRTPIKSLPDPSVKLGKFLTGRNGLFMTGKNAVAALDGEAPKLYTPRPWQGGSSYSHWDEATYPAGDPNSLMSPQFGFAESIHRVGEITKGLFKDMGWTINEQPVTLISLRQTAKVSEGPFCDTNVPVLDRIGVVPNSNVCLYYTVSNNGDLPLTLHSLSDSRDGEIFTDVNVNLAPGATYTVSRRIRVRRDELPLTNVATWTASNPGVAGEVSAVAITNLFFAPIARIQPKNEVKVTLKTGERKIRNLGIANRGGTDLTYTTVIRETGTSFAEQVVASQKVVAQLSSPATDNLTAWSLEAGASEFASTPYYGEELKSVQFATDFENFEVGPLGTQNGWIGTDSVLAQVSEEFPFSGSKHLQLLSDSTKDDEFRYRVLSPLTKGGTEPYSSFSVKLSMVAGAEYRIFPSQEVGGSLSIGAGILISPTKEVFVFNSGYVSTGYVLPDEYVDLTYVSDRVNETFDLYINDELIAEDITTSSTDVDIVEFRYYGGATGAALNIDDIQLIDGDPVAPDWVQVSPGAGIVPPNNRLNADIVFEGSGLEPGTYNAEITVITNDPFNPSAVIPVELTVVGKPTGLEPLDLVAICSEDSEQLQWQIVNPNNAAVEVTWSVVGTSQQGTIMASAGESIFSTIPAKGTNRVAIEWQRPDGKTMRRVKASNTATCGETSIATRMEIYPVPVRETLTLGLTGVDNTSGTLRIYDPISSEVIFQDEMKMTGEQEMIELSTSGIGLKPAGIYLVSFETGGKVQTKRFVVE